MARARSLRAACAMYSRHVFQAPRMSRARHRHGTRDSQRFEAEVGRTARIERACWLGGGIPPYSIVGCSSVLVGPSETYLWHGQSWRGGMYPLESMGAVAARHHAHATTRAPARACTGESGARAEREWNESGARAERQSSQWTRPHRAGSTAPRALSVSRRSLLPGPIGRRSLTHACWSCGSQSAAARRLAHTAWAKAAASKVDSAAHARRLCCAAARSSAPRGVQFRALPLHTPRLA